DENAQDSAMVLESSVLKKIEGLNVFVVDDNKTSLEILKKRLDQWKIEASVFQSATEALNALRKKQCDLIITDMRMPEMDGVSFAKNIRKIDSKVPIILLSALGEEIT